MPKCAFGLLHSCIAHLNFFRVEVIIQCSRRVFCERLTNDREWWELCGKHTLPDQNQPHLTTLTCWERSSGTAAATGSLGSHTPPCLSSAWHWSEKEEGFSSEYLLYLNWRWKGELLKVKHQISWHLVIKQTELTRPCQFDTYGELFHSGVLVW